MSGEAKVAGKRGETVKIPPLTLAENLNAQRRKLLRVRVICEDAGLGRESALVPVLPSGEIDQPKLAIVLDGAATTISEVMRALDKIIAEQNADKGRIAP